MEKGSQVESVSEAATVSLRLWESYPKAWLRCHFLCEAFLGVPLPYQSELVTHFLMLLPPWALVGGFLCPTRLRTGSVSEPPWAPRCPSHDCGSTRMGLQMSAPEQSPPCAPAVGILGPCTISRAGTGGGQRRGHRTQSPTGYSWPCLYPLCSDILQVFILFFPGASLKPSDSAGLWREVKWSPSIHRIPPPLRRHSFRSPIPAQA